MNQPPKLLDRLRAAVLARHMSPRTAATYVMWARRFILFHGKRHPSSMGAEEVNAFLTHLAVDRRVAASTQCQALAALLFLYRSVLDEPLPWLDEVVRAKRGREGFGVHSTDRSCPDGRTQLRIFRAGAAHRAALCSVTGW